MHPNVLYNDQIHSAGEKIFTPGQLGLLSGWGVFTTLRIYDGIPFAFERHWQRMLRDANLMHLDLPHDPAVVRANLLRLIEANQAREASMRVCVFRSQGGYWAGPGSGNKSDLIALTNDLQGWEPSVALDVAEQCRHAATPFAGTKTLSWAWNLTLAETANHNGFAEVILLNERGEVAECTSANIFAAKDGVTYTPPLSSGPLPGVTRAVMLAELDLPVEEKVLRLDDLYEADEVFITSTTRELMPVIRIRDRPIAPGAGGPWPVMGKLRDALSAYIGHYIDEARRQAA
ncbi:MAG TPA: aminotransferase class IV [Bryobacterales bacterium]|nr:aminotransferase class IV [Bryobacterales bacterium]